jgi:hypothetical protein
LLRFARNDKSALFGLFAVKILSDQETNWFISPV